MKIFALTIHLMVPVNHTILGEVVEGQMKRREDMVRALGEEEHRNHSRVIEVEQLEEQSRQL
jgi:hypothetical protein